MGWQDAPLVDLGGTEPEANSGGSGGASWRDAPLVSKQQPVDEGPRPSLARPMIGTADASQAQQKPAVQERSASQELLQGHYDTEAALSQRAAPLVRDLKGNLVRKVIGEIEEHDFGPVIRTPDGRTLAFNPTSDVMLRDPQTGKLTAFERAKDMDNPGILERVGRALLPGFMTTAPTRIASSGAVPMATQRGIDGLGFSRVPEKMRIPGTNISPREVAHDIGLPISRDVAPRASALARGERMQDAAAFNELGMEPFAPAFRSKGAARIARTIEEMPVVGGVVKGPKTQMETGLAEAHAKIAADLGAAQTDEAAGRVLQTGLDRFRTAGARQIEPGVLAERGIEATAPVQPSQTLSRGARASATNAESIRQELGGGVAETVRGVQVPAARPLNQTILARRGVEDMSDAELASLIRSPAAETSFGVRQEALYERANRSIPSSFRSDGSRNAGLVATPNAGQVASGLQRAEESARVKGGALEGRFGKLIRDFQNTSSNFTLDSLKAAKTEIGRVLRSFGEYDSRLDRSQLKDLYAAASRDYEAGLQTLANRAYEGTRRKPTDLNYVSPDVARAADRALREMRVADRYTRLSMERMDRFTKLLGADSAEAAVRGLASRIKEGTIDRGMIRSVSDALRPEEREQVLGYLVASMGKGRPGAKEAETIWNVSHFATDWNKNKVALRILAKDTDPAITQRLEALATRVAARVKYYENTKNFSGSAYAGIPFLGSAIALAHSVPGAILTTLGFAGGTAATGKFLTNPKYLDWMIKAAMTGDAPTASGPQVGGSSRIPALLTSLEQIAANDNELGPVILKAVADFRRQNGDPAAVDQNPDGNPRRPANVKQ
jgi:hypothetical protein